MTHLYRISTWDHDKQGWVCVAHGMKLMRLRKWVRHLRQWWDDYSILVERES
jgi:hypothetical protein